MNTLSHFGSCLNFDLIQDSTYKWWFFGACLGLIALIGLSVFYKVRKNEKNKGLKLILFILQFVAISGAIFMGWLAYNSSLDESASQECGVTVLQDNSAEAAHDMSVNFLKVYAGLSVLHIPLNIWVRRPKHTSTPDLTN